MINKNLGCKFDIHKVRINFESWKFNRVFFLFFLLWYWKIIIIDLRVLGGEFQHDEVYVPVETRTQPSTGNYCSLMIL